MTDLLPYYFIADGHTPDIGWSDDLVEGFQGLFDPDADPLGPWFSIANSYSTVECPEYGRKAARLQPPDGSVAICHGLLGPGDEALVDAAPYPLYAALVIDHLMLAPWKRRLVMSRYHMSGLAMTPYPGHDVLLWPPGEFPPRTEANGCIVISGALAEAKGLLLAMHLASEMPTSQFVWCFGKQFEPRYRHWVEVSPSNFTFRVFPTRGEYKQFVANSLCGLSVSLHESFGVSGVDFLAAGRPFVAPRSMAFPEFIQDRHLYDPWSIASMQRALAAAVYDEGAHLTWTLQEAQQVLVTALESF